MKIKSPLAKEVERALPLETMELFRGRSGNADVDAFMNAHGARKLVPLYTDIVKAKKRGLSDAQIANAVRRKFNRRASRLHGSFQPPEISRTYALEVEPGKDLAQLLQDLKANPNVEFAEADRVVQVRDWPNDPYFWSSGTWGQSYDDLWGIKKIGAPAAWNSNAGDGVIVAVVDTGIDYNHQDITANVWINANEIAGNGVDDDGNGYTDDVRGWDFVGADYNNPQQSNNPTDGFGHGTHVAGTIAGVGNNGIGVMGIAWRARVMPVKGLDNQGYGNDSTLAPAIIYAANNGADVISNSWCGWGSSQAIAEAIQYAYELGAVIVVAAGNNNDDARNYYPANLAQVITVAASDPNDAKASFSNWGSKIDVAAPGVDVLSLRAANTNMGTLVGTDYTRASGTSMATPHVSGAAALVLSQHPDFSNEDVRQVLRVSTDLSSGTIDLNFGYGRLDAANALTVASVLEAKIQSPVDGIIVTATTTISGVADGTNFVSYALEYGVGAAPSSWTLLQSGTSPVSGGTLGTFDPRIVANGLYTLRLTAFDNANHAFVDHIQLTAQAISITSPATPQVPTTAAVFKPGALITISGTATGVGFQDFRLEWAPGINPASGWSSSGMTFAGGGQLPVTANVLGTWDSSSITQAGYVTIQLTVENASYTAQTVTLVYFEPRLLGSGWPLWLDQAPSPFTSGIVPASTAAGDTRLTLLSPVYMGSSTPSRFWSLGADGSLLAKIDLYYGSYFQPAAGDLDGSAGDEVILPEAFSLRWFRADNALTVIAADAAPTPWVNLQFAQLVMDDLDGDSELETVGLGAYWPNYVAYIFAWRRDGTQMGPNFPIAIADQNTDLTYNATGPRVLVGDVDGDGKKEIIAVEAPSPSSFTLRVFANDGTPRSWTAQPYSGTFGTMALADLDHNGKLETLVLWCDGSRNILDVLQPDGTERPGWPVVLAIGPTNSFLAAGDLNRDGQEEIVVSNYSRLYVFKADGTSFSYQWPRVEPNQNPFGPVVIADVDGDGYPEIVTTRERVLTSWSPLFSSTNTGFSSAEVAASQSVKSQIGNDGRVSTSAVQTTVSAQDVTSVNYYHAPQIVALHRDGTVVRTWDLMGANGNQPYYINQLTVGDFNHDGITDVAASYNTVLGGGMNGTLQEGVVTVLSTGAPYNPGANDWPMFLQNPRNTAVRIHDVTAPVVSITSPAAGSLLSGVVTVTANATDNVAVAGVQLQVDGDNVGSELTAAPYQFQWDTGTTTLGAHNLTAVARDAAGNVAISTALNVTVALPVSASISPSTINFGNQLLNSPNPAQNVTIINTGSRSLALGISITGDFAQTNNCNASLASGASCTIAVTFTPTQRAAESGTLTVTAPGAAPLTVNLSGTGQAMIATLSPASLDFGTQTVNTSSNSQTVTYANTGDMAVAISAIATTGPFWQTNNCGSSLAPGTSCAIAIRFAPTATGSASGTLSVSGSVNASIPLTGTGQAAIATFSPTSLNFGNVEVNTTATQSITVSNSGSLSFYINSVGAGGAFSVVNHCPFTIAAGTNCNLDVTFTPTAAGTVSATMSVSGSFLGSPTYIPLSGTGTVPAPALSTGSVAFGNQLLNTTSAAQSISVTNNAKAAVSLGTVQVTGDFAQTNNCSSSLPASGSCVIYVTFTPTTRATETGTLTLSGSFTGSTVSATLSGIGQAMLASTAPISLSFGGQILNTTSAVQTVTYSNTGDVLISISTISASGDFAQTNNCGTSLAVGTNCTISVTFTPTVRGADNGSLSITGSVNSSVALNGAGQIISGAVSPASLSFSGQLLNTTSSPKAVTFTNNGDLPISISSVSTAGDFAQTNNCGTSLAVGASCTINVTFTPTARGTETGTLSLSGSVNTSITLSGTGQIISGTALPLSLAFGGQPLNTTSAAQTVTYTNNGDLPISISSISTAGDFAQTNNCGTSLAVGTSCTINVTFTPTVRGTENGTLFVKGSFNTTVILSGAGQIISGTVSPTAVIFGGQPLNTTSAAQTVTYTNNGDLPISMSGISVTGDFAQTNNCGTSLVVGASCLVNVTFTPTVRGAENGALILSGNWSGPAVSLTGTGQAVLATFSPTSINFGGQQLNTTSSPQTLTYSNTGDLPISISGVAFTGSFAQTNNCPSSLAVSANCIISVTFTPTVRGSATGSVSINGTVGASATLSGTGQALLGSVSPASLSFGNQLVNTTSVAQVVSVANTGDIAFDVSSWVMSAAFPVTTNCPYTLPSGSTCTFSVSFLPTTAGSAAGNLTINGTFPGAPATISLSGRGVAPAASFSTGSVRFASQRVGTSSTAQNTTLTNTGTAPLSITGWNVTGDFSQSNNCGSSLGVGASCTVSIVFIPTARGTRTGTLTLVSNNFGSTPAIALSGTGVAPIASVSPGSLTFANLIVGNTSASQAVTLTNTGDATLNLASISTTVDFTQSNNCTATLAVNASCSINVTLRPSAAGGRTGVLTIADDSLNGSPQTVGLSGTGLDYAISVSPSSASITAGQSTSSTVTVSALGGAFNSSVSLKCSGLPASTNCSFTPSSVTPGSSSANSTVKITTNRKTPVGTYAITIIGTSGSLQHATTLSLTVN